MAQITWQNIKAPDFSSSMLGTGAAGDRLSKVFNPLEQALKDRAAMDEDNYDNTTKNINMAIRDRIGQVGGLGELNQLGEQGLLDQARQQFGTRISEEDLRAGFANQRGILQDRAVDEALPGALAAGDKTLDLTDSGDAYYQNLDSLGMRPSVAMSKTSEFMTNNAFKERMYKEARQQNARDFLDNTLSPTNQKELITLMGEARNSNTPMDLEYLENAYQKESEGLYTDKVRADAETDRNHLLEQRAEQKRLDTALGSAISNFGPDTDITTLLHKHGRGLTGSSQIALYSTLKDLAIQKQTLLPLQQEKLKDIELHNANNLQELQDQHNTIVSHYQKIADDASGVSEEDYERTKSMESGPDGFITFLTKEAANGSILHWSSWFEDKDGNAAVAAVQAPYMALLTQGVIPEKDLKVLGWKAYHDVSDKLKSGILGQAVIPAKAYAEALNKRAENYLKAEGLREKAISVKKQADREMNTAQSTVASQQSNFIQQMMKGQPLDKGTADTGIEDSYNQSTNTLLTDSELNTKFHEQQTEASIQRLHNLQQREQDKIDAEQMSLRGLRVEPTDNESLIKGQPKQILKEAVAKYRDKPIGQLSTSKLPIFATKQGYKIKDKGGLREPTKQERREITFGIQYGSLLPQEGSLQELLKAQLESQQNKSKERSRSISNMRDYFMGKEDYRRF